MKSKGVQENNEKHYNAIVQITISSFSRIAGLASIVSCLNERKILFFREKIEFGRTGKQGAPEARCFIVTVGYSTGEARSNDPPTPAVVGLVVWLRGAQCCKTAGKSAYKVTSLRNY